MKDQQSREDKVSQMPVAVSNIPQSIF